MKEPTSTSTQDICINLDSSNDSMSDSITSACSSIDDWEIIPSTFENKSKPESETISESQTDKLPYESLDVSQNLNCSSCGSQIDESQAKKPKIQDFGRKLQVGYQDLKCSSCECKFQILNKCTKHAASSNSTACGACESQGSYKMFGFSPLFGPSVFQRKTAFHCSVCDLYFLSKVELQKHASGSHHVLLRIYNCKRCGIVLIDEKAVRDHWNAKHRRRLNIENKNV